MSTSTSLPVRVLTLIIIPPRREREGKEDEEEEEAKAKRTAAEAAEEGEGEEEEKEEEEVASSSSSSGAAEGRSSVRDAVARRSAPRGTPVGVVFFFWLCRSRLRERTHGERGKNPSISSIETVLRYSPSIFPAAS